MGLSASDVRTHKEADIEQGRQTSEALRVTHADPTDDHTPRQGDEPNTPFDGEPTRRHTTVTSPAPDGPPLVAAAEAVAVPEALPVRVADGPLDGPHVTSTGRHTRHTITDRS